jgi:hypothetical protein
MFQLDHISSIHGWGMGILPTWVDLFAKIKNVIVISFSNCYILLIETPLTTDEILYGWGCGMPEPTKEWAIKEVKEIKKKRKRKRREK